MDQSDFDEFWSHYPVKKGKGYARKCFGTLKKKKILPEIDALIAAIQNQFKERSHLRSQNEFVPPWKHPSTWLNQECWEDECHIPSKTTRTAPQIAPAIDNMIEAYNIIAYKHKGDMEHFRAFCDKAGISQEDRERILMKYKGSPLVNEVQKIANGLFQGTGEF